MFDGVFQRNAATRTPGFALSRNWREFRDDVHCAERGIGLQRDVGGKVEPHPETPIRTSQPNPNSRGRLTSSRKRDCGPQEARRRITAIQENSDSQASNNLKSSRLKLIESTFFVDFKTSKEIQRWWNSE
jgi:hypothetical protein